MQNPYLQQQGVLLGLQDKQNSTMIYEVVIPLKKKIAKAQSALLVPFKRLEIYDISMSIGQIELIRNNIIPSLFL